MSPLCAADLFLPAQVGRIVPPLFSTLSALTELAVTAVVVYFFVRILRDGTYRFGIMAVALAYETLFNISYMTSRLFSIDHSTAQYPGWFMAFLGFHGALSLLMFLALVAYVIWAFDRTGKGDADPIGRRPRLAYTFLMLWAVSIATGELIYVLQWTGAVQI